MTTTNSSRRNFIKLTAAASVATTGLATACINSEKQYEKPEKRLTFLFQGDSITDGNRGRNEDPNHILGHGYCFAVSSRIGADFPEAGFTFFNRGISGNTVTDLDRRWQTDTLDINPDVLSLLVGINDVNALVNGRDHAVDLDTFETTYRKLLTSCRKQNPDLLIVLGLPFFFASGWRKDQYETWYPLTVQHAEVVKCIAADFNAVLIDYPKVFEEALKRAPIDYWIWDGVHPTVFGHELMAREWISRVSSKLGFLKVYSE